MEFNPLKNKILQFLNNPYSVQYSKRVEKSLKYALERNLIDEYDIEYRTLRNYFTKGIEIPLWVVEAACRINLKDVHIPAEFQYLWFCLHATILTRKQPSGRVFRTRVNFSPCYIELDDGIRKLLSEASKSLNLPIYEFVRLGGINKTDSNKSISLLLLLKICQILRIDIWNLLTGCELFGKTKKTGKITILSSILDADLMVLLIWLRTEGHIELGSTHIEINQKDNIKSLKTLRKIIVEKFNIKNSKPLFLVGKRGEDRLIISSSPLKQLLCLKYNFPLGYKSGSLQPLDLGGFSHEDYKKMMATFIQTEGCLSYTYTRNKKKRLPRFEFIVKDRSLAVDCLFTLRKLGFYPSFSEKQNIFKVGLYNSKQVIDLVHQTRKYVFDEKKIDYLREVCTSGIGL